jgi:peroxiredoxin
MTITVGARLPAAKFRTPGADGPTDIESADLFDGKKIVLFAVPGAFTPTCSMNHLPGYLDKRDAILAKGVDDIAVIAVNDVHVMRAWSEATGGKGKIRFLADGNAAFTRAIGMDNDMGAMGVRSKRFSMIVEDGVVKALNVEDNPGKALESGAEKLLEQL